MKQDNLGSVAISLLIPQLMVGMAFIMDMFVYDTSTVPTMLHKWFWVISIVASSICFYHREEILPSIIDDRKQRQKEAIIWAIGIGAVVLFILFGFGHSYVSHHQPTI